MVSEGEIVDVLAYAKNWAFCGILLGEKDAEFDWYGFAEQSLCQFGPGSYLDSG